MPRHAPIIPGFAHMLHGADYNPDQWLDRPDILDEDERIAKLAHMNSWSVAIFGWTALEPEEGRHTFEWLDDIMDRMAKNGMRACLATPSGARPHWMGLKYPEVNRVTPEGRRNKTEGRHNHCWTSPVYREKVADINRRLAERYAKHPAMGLWHLSNEYGGECHCPLCKAAFRAWLQGKYENLDALNHAWWSSFWSHRYTDWEQIDAIDSSVLGMVLDWNRFTSDQAADFIAHEGRALREFSDAPLVTNLMGTYPGLDYRRLAPVLDAISWDAYPLFLNHDEQNIEVASRFAFLHDLTRGLKRQPFLLMESSPGPTNWQKPAKLTRPGLHKLKSLQAVAHGSDSVQYFQYRNGRGGSEQFHGAVVGHVGDENTRMFREIADLGRALEKLDDVVGCPVPAEAAIVYDWESRWMLDMAQGPAREVYEAMVIDHYRAFWERGVPVDVVGRGDDFSKYKLLATPAAFLLDAATAKRIAEYVRGGGTWVATCYTGIVDEKGLAWLGGWPGGGLREVLGLWVEETDVYEDGGGATVASTAAGAAAGLRGSVIYRAPVACDVIHAQGAQALAVYADQFYAGSPAVLKNAFGRGRAYYLGSRFEADLLADLYGGVLKEAGVEASLPGVALARGVSVQTRTDGSKRYHFVMNFGTGRAHVDLGKARYRDMLEGGEVTGVLTLEGYGIKVLQG